MPPKAKFTREEVVAAALSIVERDGIDRLTARSLGRELGCSARPIFTIFTGMDEVVQVVFDRANAIYWHYVEEGLKEDIAFKGVGKSYIRFATEHSKLFQLLFMKERDVEYDVNDVLLGIEDHYEEILESIESAYGVKRDVAKELYFHLWVYSHGIAVLIATKVCMFTQEQVSRQISEVFISLLKRFKSEEVL